jgi:hypothetical protein
MVETVKARREVGAQGDELHRDLHTVVVTLTRQLEHRYGDSIDQQVD